MYFCLFGACRLLFETCKDTRSTREFWWNSWNFPYTFSVASPLKIAPFPSIKEKCYQIRMWKWKKINKNNIIVFACAFIQRVRFFDFTHLIPFFLVSLLYPCNNDNAKVEFQMRPWLGKHDTKVNVVNNVMPSHTLSSICMKWTFQMKGKMSFVKMGKFSPNFHSVAILWNENVVFIFLVFCLHYELLAGI